MRPTALNIILALATAGFSQTHSERPLPVALEAASPIAYEAAPSVTPPAKSFARQEGTAYLMAAGSTLIPVGLAFASANAVDNPAFSLSLGFGGALIGPSMGQFYAGSALGGAGGILIRSLGGLLVLNGGLEAYDDVMCDMDFGGGDGDCDGENGRGTMVLGTAIYAAGTVISLLDTHWAYQRKRRAGQAALQWSPILALDRSGKVQSGAAVQMRF